MRDWLERLVWGQPAVLNCGRDADQDAFEVSPIAMSSPDTLFVCEDEFQEEPDFRDLFGAILEHRRKPLYWQLLAPWSEANTEEKRWLAEFSKRRGSPIPDATDEELWRLYALSRVNEILLLRFQHGRADGTDYPGPEISLNEYVLFMESLGLRAVDQNCFAPFYHEIIEVEQSDDPDAPIEVVSTFWPSLMLGEMMFSRAGVWVTGGTRHVRKEIAESSTLYWAFRRKNRPFQDLSLGWGSNSQWRTSFRRDYRIGPTLHFNVDAKHILGGDSNELDRDDLTANERLELLVNRCFITVDKPHTDLWPYDDTFCLASQIKGEEPR